MPPSSPHVDAHAAHRPLALVDAHAAHRPLALDHSRRQRVVVDPVRAGDDVQPFRVDRGIRLHRAGNEIDLIGRVTPQARAFRGDQPTGDMKATEATVRVEERRAGGQHAARGVDEAAAIDHDPRRVGDHHLGPAARDLDGAAQLARVAAVDLVEDDPRGLAGRQVRIAVDEGRPPGLHDRRRVVQDHARARHVELRVVVA